MGSRHWGFVAGALFLLIASGLTAFAGQSAGLSAEPQSPSNGSARPGTTPLLAVTDGTTATLALGSGVFATVRDSTVDGTTSPHSRSYWILLNANHAYPNVALHLYTTPVRDWGFPDQLPGGVDSLPPLSLWQWTVWHGTTNDTANWTEFLSAGLLLRNTVVGNDVFRVVGTSWPVLPVTVQAGVVSAATPTRLGVFLQGPGLIGGLAVVTDPDYSSLAAPLGLNIVRIGLSSIGTQASWNSDTHSPWFNFSNFDAAAQLAHQLGSHLFVSLPAGTWGDGNLLPTGMPYDSNLPVAFAGTVGYFPQGASYVSFLDAILNHTAARGENVTYWNVGNEMPLDSPTVVGRYIALFNLAARTIHAVEPNALVGSDVMTNRTYESQFANQTRGVGYLSFHFYPAAGLCVVNGSYCAPGFGPGTGTPDASLFRVGASISGVNFYAPFDAASRWHNATGTWLPVLASESNLNGAGGNPTNWAVGSDPRQQSQFAASWLISTLLNATAQNVSNFVYFTFTGQAPANTSVTGALGGWGFGLTSEGTHDNNTRYAPYWALSMWTNASPAGSTPLQVTSDPTDVVGALATGNSTVLHVLLVNRADFPVSVPVEVSGANTTVVSVQILDNRSYVQTMEGARDAVVLDQSALTTRPGPLNVVHLRGYGVALVTERFDRSHHGIARMGPAGNGSGTPRANSSGQNLGARVPGPGANGPRILPDAQPLFPLSSDPAAQAVLESRAAPGTPRAGDAGSRFLGVTLSAEIAATGLIAIGCLAVWRWIPRPHPPRALGVPRRSSSGFEASPDRSAPPR